jgi:hypothetical protein
MTPSSLQFLAISPGTTAVQTVVLANSGSSDCVITGVAFASGTDSAFALAGAITTGDLPPGAAINQVVSFTPPEVGCYYGTLVVSSVYAGLQKIPLGGEGSQANDTCFSLPSTHCWVDFGVVGISDGQYCVGAKLKFVGINGCSTPVTVEALTLTPADGGITLWGFDVPVVIAPGSTTSPFTVGFRDRPYDSVLMATISIQTDLQPEPFLVAFGNFSQTHGSTQTDTFTGDVLLGGNAFPLSGNPDPTSLALALDGNALSDAGWSYNSMANDVIVNSPSTFQASDVLTISYWLACQ